jgi:hypothetical protein
MIKNCLIEYMAAAIYRQQKVLSHFPVCCWIDLLLTIKNCIIESGPPCRWTNSLQGLYSVRGITTAAVSYLDARDNKIVLDQKT